MRQVTVMRTEGNKLSTHNCLSFHLVDLDVNEAPIHGVDYDEDDDGCYDDYDAKIIFRKSKKI
jgi:hypothetical protein